LVFAAVATGCASPRLVSEPWVSGSDSDATAVTTAVTPAVPTVPGATPAGASGAVEGGEPTGYPKEGRIIGGPADIEVDLATSFPRPDSILPSLIPKGWFRLKKRIYDCAGIQLALSYQSIYQYATDTLPLADSDRAWGGWALFEAKWEAVDRGGERPGSLIAALDWRHEIGRNPNPAEFQLATGSGWPTGFAFFEWDPSLTLIFWEQWLKKDVLEVRVGKQLPISTFDFFRFKDARVSFTGDPFTTTVATMPAPGFAQGVSFKWWPFRRPDLKSLYVHGTMNDMNGSAEDFGLDTFVKGQFFYGLEIGYHWKRKFPKDFDHAHVDIWYADERTDPYDLPSGLPNKAGWGFKLAGSKQCGRFVGFANYTYNEAEGGGFGLTLARQGASLGGVLLKPAGIGGEIGLGLSWLRPFDERLDDQYGAEAYWRVLVTPDLWVTPGVQLVWDPTLNPATDFIAIPQIKFRLFL